jgi:thymidylate synthase
MKRQGFDNNACELVEKALIPLKTKLDRKEVVAGTVELINLHLTFDPREIFIDLGTSKRAPRKYIKKELDWYLSKDRRITGHIDDVEIWRSCAAPNGMVNSNYGWCIFSTENCEQFDRAVEQLLQHEDGRQSVCIYTRPSIQHEWNDDVNAHHDFICTFATQHFIRNGKLEYIVYMRSNDLIFGLINDYAWHAYVYEQMLNEVNRVRKEVGLSAIDYGNIYWNDGSGHVYERHWELLEKVVDEYMHAMPLEG